MSGEATATVRVNKIGPSDPCHRHHLRSSAAFAGVVVASYGKDRKACRVADVVLVMDVAEKNRIRASRNPASAIDDELVVAVAVDDDDGGDVAIAWEECGTATATPRRNNRQDWTGRLKLLSL